MDPQPVLVSLVVPVLNEERNIDLVYRRVVAVFDALGPRYDFEFVFTDNHSTDSTFERIAELAKTDPRVRAYRFSRNFGYQRSILEGYRRTRGLVAVQLDADLQDPPELIGDFLALWTQGYKVVYGIRTERREGALITAARRAFYRIANAMAEDELPVDAGDFRLVDRCVIDLLRGLDDAQPYLRGTIAALGFNQVGVEYARDERTHGESKFNLNQLMALSLDGILNHSTVPLRVATYTGLVISFLTFAGMAAFLIGRLVFGAEWPAGFATTTVLILLSISLNALFLGVIGEYLGRIYKQVKRGPNTVIEQAIDTPESPQ